MGNPIYGIYKPGGGYYRLCKALKDYNNEKEAIDDLILQNPRQNASDFNRRMNGAFSPAMV